MNTVVALMIQLCSTHQATSYAQLDQAACHKYYINCLNYDAKNLKECISNRKPLTEEKLVESK